MVFSSIPFLFVFLPVTLLGYFLIPSRYLGLRNSFLLLMNLIFYAYGEPVYVLLMLAAAVSSTASTRITSSGKVPAMVTKLADWATQLLSMP